MSKPKISKKTKLKAMLLYTASEYLQMGFKDPALWILKHMKADFGNKRRLA